MACGGRGLRADGLLPIAFAAVSLLLAAETLLALGGTTPFPFSVVLLTLVLIAALGRMRGTRAALPLAGLTLAIPFASEFSGVLLGLPYGRYHYGDAAGPRLLGLVPLFIYVAWLAFLCAVVVTSTVALGRSGPLLAPLDGLMAVGLDLMIDPLAVQADYWTWDEPGAFYGIPATNFLGWFAVVALASALLRARWPWVLEGLTDAPRGLLLLFPLAYGELAVRYALQAIAAGMAAAALGLLLGMPLALRALALLLAPRPAPEAEEVAAPGQRSPQAVALPPRGRPPA